MILRAGNGGFLYVDIISALIILSLSSALLLSSTRTLLKSIEKEEILYHNCREVYESILLEQIQK